MGRLKDFKKKIKETGENNCVYTGVIYCYTNLINGKKYIGQTIDEIDRRYRHKSKSKADKPKQFFHKAIKKYGWDNFKYKCLFKKDYINREDCHFNLDLLEIYYINKFNTTKEEIGYNIGVGGTGSNGSKGKILSIETRQKISNSQRGVKHSKVWVNKVAEKHKKSVVQYSLNGEYIREYDSITDATISNNIKGSSAISAVCRNRRKSAGGFIWKYAK